MDFQISACLAFEWNRIPVNVMRCPGRLDICKKKRRVYIGGEGKRPDQMCLCQIFPLPFPVSPLSRVKTLTYLSKQTQVPLTTWQQCPYCNQEVC